MNIVEQAIDSLIGLFKNKEKYRNFFTALLAPMLEIETAAQYLIDNRDMDNAVGWWLDKDGQIIGAERLIGETPEDELFEFGDVSDNGIPYDNGFADLAGTTGGKIFAYAGNYIPGTLMSDPVYLTYMRAKAIATFQGSSLYDIVEFVYNAFGVTCLAEFQELSDVLVTLDEHLSYSDKRVLQQYAPVSAGSKLAVSEYP